MRLCELLFLLFTSTVGAASKPNIVFILGATMFISIIAQEQNDDWIDVLLQAGIIGTFVVFAIAMVFIKPGMSKKSKDDGDDGRR